jgi:hypothetical protein
VDIDAIFIERCMKGNPFCLHLNGNTIAFPSIGNGYLRYPVEDVARTMFQTVQKFAAERNDGCLKELSFVIYYKDHQSLQVIKQMNIFPKSLQVKKRLNILYNLLDMLQIYCRYQI